MFSTRWVVVGLCMAASVSWGALSGNLINGGNFEGDANSFFKNYSTYDLLNNEVPAHRFNQQGDLGLWLEFWGDPSLYPGNAAWNGLGGFTSMNNPRDPADPRPMTRLDRLVSNMNRSYDAQGNNHYLENTMFRPRFAQWVAAPEGHVAGPIEFSFDFYYNDWDQATHDYNNNHIVEVQLYGVNFLPPHNTSILTDEGGGAFVMPLGPDPSTPLPGYDAQVLESFYWGGWWTDDDWNDDDSTNGWITLSTNNPTDPNWSRGRSWATVVNTDVTQTWQYYAICVHSITYTENSPLFESSDGFGDIVPILSQGFDNFNLKVSVGSAVLVGDVNLDGDVNALDISYFVERLVQNVYQVEADTNFDGKVNALDISGFVTCLVSGCNGVAGGSVVPEPASLGLLIVGAAVVCRWRKF